MESEELSFSDETNDEGVYERFGVRLGEYEIVVGDTTRFVQAVPDDDDPPQVVYVSGPPDGPVDSTEEADPSEDGATPDADA